MSYFILLCMLPKTSNEIAILFTLLILMSFAFVIFMSTRAGRLKFTDIAVCVILRLAFLLVSEVIECYFL